LTLEVEVKIKLTDKPVFFKRLRELNAKHVSNIIHTDIYYNSPYGDRDFAKTDEALRLRKNIEYKIKSSTSQSRKKVNPESSDFVFNIPQPDNACAETCDITYKGPKLDALTKSRIEHVCEIMDSCAMDSILEAIGFKQIITIRKERMLFEIDYKGTHIGIMVDTIQYLEGTYAEFEIVVEDKQQMSEAKTLIFSLMHEMGYSEQDSIRTSYLELIMQAKNKK
jgi:adenylate cyclase class 2